ncbi:MAG: MFS transporter, partial [Dehalococcoidia bacterium]
KEYLKKWVGLFKIKSFVFITLGQICFAVVYFTWLGWVPAFIIRAYNVDAAQAGSIVGVAALTGIVGSVLGGFIADYWHKRNKGARGYMMAIVQFLNMIILGFIVYFMGAMSIPTLMILMIVQMVVVAFVNPLIFSLLPDITDPSHRMAGQGLMVTFAYAAGAAIGPWVVGVVSDSVGGGAEGIRQGFLWLLPVALLCAIFYSINSKFYPADSAKVSDRVYAEK